MPQLDPIPWFFIFCTSWSILLTFAPTKITKFEHLNDPAQKQHKSLNTPWSWPWA